MELKNIKDAPRDGTPIIALITSTSGTYAKAPFYHEVWWYKSDFRDSYDLWNSTTMNHGWHDEHISGWMDAPKQPSQ